MSEQTETARFFEESDADPSLLKDRRLAVIGFGSQGHAHALNQRDHGVSVVVGLYEGSPSAAVAREQSLEVKTVAEAAEWADVISILIPDTKQAEVYHTEIEPHLSDGDILVFAHGFNIHYGEIDPPEGVDTILIAPKSPGQMVRSEYVAGRGVPALVGVHRDASGKALDYALAYAAGLGSTRTGVLETTFGDETETDLFGEQAVLCGGLSELVKAGFETLVDAGYDPRLAYFECLHELKLIIDLAYAKGLSGMRAEISDTAEWGDYESGRRVIGEASRTAMREVLDEIQSGAFAKKWIEEARGGAPNFQRRRQEERGHIIESTGDALRARMSWL
jgi:ketol-acid reductoisomerase